MRAEDNICTLHTQREGKKMEDNTYTNRIYDSVNSHIVFLYRKSIPFICIPVKMLFHHNSGGFGKFSLCAFDVFLLYRSKKKRIYMHYILFVHNMCSAYNRRYGQKQERMNFLPVLKIFIIPSTIYIFNV